MSTFLVNAGGLILMATIVWWFWLSPSDGSQSSHDHNHH
jgi:plastocyanin domain-containing protein